MSKFVVSCTWDEVPHLGEKERERLWADFPEWERDARFKGIPVLGSGAIYTTPESDILVPDFEIPDHFPRAFGLDVGWLCTAAVWAARDLESGVTYLYSDYWRGEAEPSIHSDGIKSRGEWIPGVIDPNAEGRGQKDGVQLLLMYKKLGLDLQKADNSVETGIRTVWQMLSSGKLKVFKSCRRWLEEYRLYRRDTKGRIVKENDHLMDATRYLIMSGLDRMICEPARKKAQSHMGESFHGDRGWMRV